MKHVSHAKTVLCLIIALQFFGCTTSRAANQTGHQLGRNSGHPYLTYSDANIQKLKERIASRVVILLTDGQNNSGKHQPLEAAALAMCFSSVNSSSKMPEGFFLRVENQRKPPSNKATSTPRPASSGQGRWWLAGCRHTQSYRPGFRSILRDCARP